MSAGGPSTRWVRRGAVVGFACLLVAGCGSSGSTGSSGSKEETFVVREASCSRDQTFTRKEVIETWGQGAIVNGELRDGPAGINKICEQQEKHEPKHEEKTGQSEPEKHSEAEGGSGGEKEGPGSSSHAEDAKFCEEHQCIANFSNGHGEVVECNDGQWSHSGGISGACSSHGGEKH